MWLKAIVGTYILFHGVTGGTHPSPILVTPFSDNISHFQKAFGTDAYARYSVDDFEKIADNILAYQRANGGWPSNWDPLRVLSPEEREGEEKKRLNTDTTFDNRTTYTHVEYLAEVFDRTGKDIYKEAATRGMNFILSAQYANGGFPHSYPDTAGYHPHITFMDDVMIGVLETLGRASKGTAPFGFLSQSLRDSAGTALQQGLACVLRLQVRVDGRPAGWAGQYDEQSLIPTTGRSYELPSLVSAETVQVTRFLMEIEEPSPAIMEAVEGAVSWLERSKISGIRVETFDIEPVQYEYYVAKTDRKVLQDPQAPPIWARFYEIDTNRPFMANRDGVKVYSLAEVSNERRVGYGWYTTAPARLLEREYPSWRQRWCGANGVAK